MRLVILGLPGAGKGTQGQLLGEHFGIPPISTGDMFRDALQSETELGLEVKQYVERGGLVPDRLTVELVKERLAAEDTREGFLLDGFPRTVAQAKALETILTEAGHRLDAAVFVDVPQEESLRRISLRRVCEQCGATYGPDAGETCTSCGGKLVKRQDDPEETVRARLQVYTEQTVPVVDYYDEAGILVRADGLQSIDDVLADIIDALDALGDNPETGDTE